MNNQTNIDGNNNIVIQNVTDSIITLKIGDEILEIQRQLSELSALLKDRKTIQTADKIYNIENINEANFSYIIEQANKTKQFPKGLQDEMIEDDAEWVESLKDDLLNEGINYSDNKLEVFSHYGWLIQDYLRKLIAFDNDNENEDELSENEQLLIRLSYMTEAFHSSIRYLCYIQLAQLFKTNPEYSQQNPKVNEFIHMEYSEKDEFDYLDLLLNVTNLLDNKAAFVPEIQDLVNKLSVDIEEDLYETVLFLEKYRTELQEGTINVDEIQDFYKKYLTALIYWLRNLAFLAKYKLVSIKNININYILGGAKYFEHLYGELHGFYQGTNFSNTSESAYDTLRLEEKFTYNRSVLLLKGRTLIDALNNFNNVEDYLSLSPLVIDQSVFMKTNGGQTPEIYYFKGRINRDFYYFKYNNELPFFSHQPTLIHEQIKSQNTEKPEFNQFYKHIKAIFKPYKTPQK